MDAHEVALHAVRLGDVRSRKRQAAAAARLDAVRGRRAGRRRERVDVVVGVAPEHRHAVAEPVVDAHVGRRAVLRALGDARVVVGQAAAGRRRIERHVLHRDRVEPVGRNLVVGKRRARRQRIVDGDGQLAEVAVAHPGRRHGDHVGDALLLLEPFVVGEEERPIGAERSTEAAAILMLAEHGLGRGEEVLRVEAIVAGKLERRPAEAVGARLGEDVHDAAGGAPGLGRVVTGLDLDLGDGVDGRLDANRADRALVVVHPVDELIVLVVQRAVDGNRRRLAPIVRARAARQRVRQAFIGTRRQLDEAHEIAAVHRQILDGLLGDERRQRRGVGLEQRRGGGHGNGLGDQADLQFGVEPDAIAGRQRHLGRLGAEPLQRHSDRVAADRHRLNT